MAGCLIDKKTISFLKQKYPKIFYTLTRSYWVVRCLQELDRPRYWYCLLANKPYFGTIALAGQTWETRKTAMHRLARAQILRHPQKPLRILEIGSWAGNSAVLWADTIQTCGAQGTVLCIDGWEPYVDAVERQSMNIAPVLMNEALKKKQVLKLFLHNIRSSGHADKIHLIKGFSQDILPYLKHHTFDLIFIDGDHTYSGVRRDLESVADLLAEDGVVCGDDLDLQFPDVDAEFTRTHKERNMMFDPKNKKEYHPGVCLAVYEFFGGRVSCENGFWMMRKTKDGWEKILLEEAGLANAAV